MKNERKEVTLKKLKKKCRKYRLLGKKSSLCVGCKGDL